MLSVGAKVFITCRSQTKVDETVAKLKAQNSQAEVEGLVMELSSLKSTRECAEKFISSGKLLNVLINNAGVMACPLEHTVDGYEMQVDRPLIHTFRCATEEPVAVWREPPEPLPPHQAAAACAAGRRRPRRAGRVVNLSSMGQFLFAPTHGISLDDLDARTSYHPWTRYGESKLANILHAKELTRRFGAAGVSAIAVHPGAILETDLKRHFGAGVVAKMLCRLLRSPRAMGVVLSSANKNTAQVAAAAGPRALCRAPAACFSAGASECARAPRDGRAGERGNSGL